MVVVVVLRKKEFLFCLGRRIFSFQVLSRCYFFDFFFAGFKSFLKKIFVLPGYKFFEFCLKWEKKCELSKYIRYIFETITPNLGGRSTHVNEWKWLYLKKLLCGTGDELSTRFKGSTWKNVEWFFSPIFCAYVWFETEKELRIVSV